MTDDHLHLLNLIEEEFQGIAGVRIRLISPSTTKRSIDLPQDYNPEAANVHAQSGVIVKTKSREFFFPTEWLTEETRASLHSAVKEVKEFLGI